VTLIVAAVAIPAATTTNMHMNAETIFNDLILAHSFDVVCLLNELCLGFRTEKTGREWTSPGPAGPTRKGRYPLARSRRGIFSMRFPFPHVVEHVVERDESESNEVNPAGGVVFSRISMRSA
jgi:hypothetical protein